MRRRSEAPRGVRRWSSRDGRGGVLVKKKAHRMTPHDARSIGVSRPPRRIVFDETVPLRMALEAIDLDVLRRGFSDLFDRAALAASQAGLDLDDTIVDRRLVCKSVADESFQVEAVSLTDAGRVLESVRAAARGKQRGPTEIVGLRATAWYDQPS